MNEYHKPCINLTNTKNSYSNKNTADAIQVYEHILNSLGVFYIFGISSFHQFLVIFCTQRLINGSEQPSHSAIKIIWFIIYFK